MNRAQRRALSRVQGKNAAGHSLTPENLAKTYTSPHSGMRLTGVEIGLALKKLGLDRAEELALAAALKAGETEIRLAAWRAIEEAHREG